MRYVLFWLSAHSAWWIAVTGWAWTDDCEVLRIGDGSPYAWDCLEPIGVALVNVVLAAAGSVALVGLQGTFWVASALGIAAPALDSGQITSSTPSGRRGRGRRSSG